MVTGKTVCKASPAAGWLLPVWLPPLVAVGVAALALPGYSPLRHGLSTLSGQVPWLALVLFLWPGLGMAGYAYRGRAALPPRAGLAWRLGWQMALLAGLAFAMQGLLPFAPGQPADEGGNRLHVVAGMLWWLCLWLVAGCAVWAGALPRLRRGALALVWLALPAGWLLAPVYLDAAVVQYLALGAWALTVLLMRAASRPHMASDVALR